MSVYDPFNSISFTLSRTYNNKLLHMCSNNNSIKQIDNIKICGRCENTGEGVLLTIGYAEGVKMKVRCQNTGKYTAQCRP